MVCHHGRVVLDQDGLNKHRFRFGCRSTNTLFPSQSSRMCCQSFPQTCSPRHFQSASGSARVLSHPLSLLHAIIAVSVPISISITVSSSLSTLPSQYCLLAPPDSQSTSVIGQALQQSISVQHCPCLHLLKERSVMAIMTVCQSHRKDHWSRRRRKRDHLNIWMISEDIGRW